MDWSKSFVNEEENLLSLPLSMSHCSTLPQLSGCQSWLQFIDQSVEKCFMQLYMLVNIKILSWLILGDGQSQNPSRIWSLSRPYSPISGGSRGAACFRNSISPANCPQGHQQSVLHLTSISRWVTFAILIGNSVVHIFYNQSNKSKW